MISIIVPIYNAAHYLNECVDSLLMQTEQDLQIILVDDGSSDNSPALAQRYAAKDKRIELHTIPHSGQSAARNEGLKHVKGEFVAFVDADDRLAPEWCARHLKATEGVQYVQSGYRRCKQEEVSRPNYPCNAYRFTSPCMRLYRREAIEGLRFTEGMIYEDVLWSVDLWLSGAVCRKIRYAGYLYTLNPKSTTSQRHPEAEQRVFGELRKRVDKASRKGKWILFYTLIRLKIHFLLS